MHIILSGVVTLLSLLSMLLLGIWFNRLVIFPGFGTYTFLNIGVIVLSTGFFVAKVDSPIMGLAERIPVLASVLWIFILALWMSSSNGYVGRKSF
jgi:hypothetical protein